MHCPDNIQPMNQKTVCHGYYPVYVDLKEKKVVVVGGGTVAERKVEGLLMAQAQVSLISPEITKALEEMRSQGLIDHVARKFVREDLNGAWLVIASTDDPAVQKDVYEESTARGIFCNVVDQPEYCSFIVPSMVRRGDLCIAISTGGKSPALAQRLRKELEKDIGPFYSGYVSLLGALRHLILKSSNDPETKKRLCQSLAEPKVTAWVRDDEWDLVKEWAGSLCGREGENIVLDLKCRI